MGVKICIRTNDTELFYDFQNEYKYHLKFLEDNIYEKNVATVNVLRSQKMYIDYFKKIRKIKEKVQYYCAIRRENIILIDKNKSEISIIYDEYNEEKLQYLGEIIFGIFGKELEDRGYYFLHAACVSKEQNGILILEKNPRKRILLLLKLLEEKFDFLCSSHIGVKIENGVLKAIAIPTRLGISIEELYSNTFNRNSLEAIKEVKDFKKSFSDIDEKILQTKYSEKKFNVKVNEIKEILRNNLILETNIKTIVEIEKRPRNFNNSKYKKISNEELIEIFIKNKRKGIYDTVSYISNLYNRKENKIVIPKINTIDILSYLFYQSDKKDLENIARKINNIINE